MLVWATKTLPAVVGRWLFFAGLFVAAAVVQMAGTAALRAQGLNAGAALLAAGAGVLAFVLLANGAVLLLRQRAERRLEAWRARYDLPAGACCVVWRPGAAGQSDMPWQAEGVVKADYPPLAQKLGIEGYAIVDFEMTSAGAPKNLHCVDAWPGQVFYDAAAAGLTRARFNLKQGEAPRLGKFYRMPFVFRIEGQAQLAAPARPSRRRRA